MAFHYWSYYNNPKKMGVNEHRTTPKTIHEAALTKFGLKGLLHSFYSFTLFLLILIYPTLPARPLTSHDQLACCAHERIPVQIPIWLAFQTEKSAATSQDSVGYTHSYQIGGHEVAILPASLTSQTLTLHVRVVWGNSVHEVVPPVSAFFLRHA